jgi:hypothetical protein
MANTLMNNREERLSLDVLELQTGLNVLIQLTNNGSAHRHE